MGVIALALVAAGRLDGGETVDVPIWVILSAALAMGLGTYVGGWRIIRTLGRQITEVTPPRGFAAETSAGTVILAASFFGYPLSTTHVASGSILGSGAVGRRQGVRWDIAGNVFVAWLITLPVAACIAAVAVWLPGALGARSVAGPMVMTVVAIVGAYLLWRIAQRRPVTADNVNG
jgi:inorganic phosphate transporter, PiT family